jgi:hypothetical protein
MGRGIICRHQTWCRGLAAGRRVSNWALIRKDSVFEGIARQPPRADVMLLPGTKAKPKGYFRLRYEE